jgi:hypothetical protein
MSPQEALGVAFILLGLSVPVIVVGVVYIIKKRLEHKQIMTAIEKGTPLSELRPPKPNGALWVRNLTVGIALLVIGLGWGIIVPGGHEVMLVALILSGIGIAWIVRGLLNRKYQAPSRPLAQSKNCGGISASETSRQ